MLVGELPAIHRVLLRGRWCLRFFFRVYGKKKNDTSFEDQYRTLEEIKSLFFKTLYLWTVAYVSHFTISYSDFLVLFTHSSQVLPLVYFLCT
jgi:hypothetical protein